MTTTIGKQLEDVGFDTVKDIVEQLNMAIEASDMDVEIVSRRTGYHPKNLETLLNPSTKRPNLSLNLLAKVCAVLGVTIHMWMEPTEETDGKKS